MRSRAEFGRGPAAIARRRRRRGDRPCVDQAEDLELGAAAELALYVGELGRAGGELGRGPVAIGELEVPADLVDVGKLGQRRQRNGAILRAVSAALSHILGMTYGRVSEDCRARRGGGRPRGLRRPLAAALRGGSARSFAALVRDDPPVSRADLLELLGLPASATVGEIKVRYRELARRFHPDVNDDARACSLLRHRRSMTGPVAWSSIVDGWYNEA